MNNKPFSLPPEVMARFEEFFQTSDDHPLTAEQIGAQIEAAYQRMTSGFTSTTRRITSKIVNRQQLQQFLPSLTSFDVAKIAREKRDFLLSAARDMGFDISLTRTGRRLIRKQRSVHRLDK